MKNLKYKKTPKIPTLLTKILGDGGKFPYCPGTSIFVVKLSLLH
jgi:hypothetical protein